MFTNAIASGEFQRVLLGIDGYGRAAELASVVRAIAPTARRTLVRVFPVMEPVDGRPRDTTLREEALAMLASERINAVLPDAAIAAVGDANGARGLQRAAADAGADLLVIGPSGRSPRGRMMLGEAGRAIFQGAPCPVLISPRGAHSAPDRPRTIGVAFDGSPEASHALALAGAIASSLGARLEVVQAIDGVDGPARETLAALAQRVDVVFCGSRGWGPLARVAFGSTADDLIRDARCPVIVVPRGTQIRRAEAGSEPTIPTPISEADHHA